MFGHNVGVKSECSPVFLGEQINDDSAFEFFVEHGREFVVPPLREQPKRCESCAHFESVVGHRFIGTNRTQQTRDHDDAVERTITLRSSEGRNIEMIPNHTCVALMGG